MGDVYRQYLAPSFVNRNSRTSMKLTALLGLIALFRSFQLIAQPLNQSDHPGYTGADRERGANYIN